MNVNFLFLDDTISQETKISSVCGVLIPLDQYPDMRRAFYSKLADFIIPEPNFINLSPPELHGRALFAGMPEVNDERKIRAVKDVADILESFQIDLYRVGYYLDTELLRLFKGNEKLTVLCFGSILNCLQERLSTEAIIPVMDFCSIEDRRKLSGSIKSCDIVRESGHESWLSVKNTKNILGELFYADSSSSVFIQVADIVAYAMHVTDWQTSELPMTDFKKGLVSAFQSVMDRFVVNEVVRMKIHPSQNAPVV